MNAQIASRMQFQILKMRFKCRGKVHECEYKNIADADTKSADADTKSADVNLDQTAIRAGLYSQTNVHTKTIYATTKRLCHQEKAQGMFCTQCAPPHVGETKISLERIHQHKNDVRKSDGKRSATIEHCEVLDHQIDNANAHVINAEPHFCKRHFLES